MDLATKIELLTDAGRFDMCGSFASGGQRYTPQRATWAEAADDGDTRPRPVFRALMSSRCAWNCAYCPLRAGSDTERAALEPAELAQVFLPRYEAGAVQGLFLSTAVDGSVGQAMERMLDAVELLRARHAYEGYVHVKLLPGAGAGDVERAARLADRISLNLEAPSAAHLARISPERSWSADLIERLRWAREWEVAARSYGPKVRGTKRGARAERAASATRPAPLTPRLASGLATQFVVGAAGEADRELLLTGAWLYEGLGLRRVYFGAFTPVAGTPLEEALSTPQVRVTRLQQADWLLRNYEFRAAELPFDGEGDLPLHLDPKLAWALAHPERFPIELNSAPPEALLRVPGLGPISVERVLRLRRQHSFRAPEHLAALGPQAARARDFVTLDGHFFGRDPLALHRHYAPRGPIVEQLRLF